MASLAVFVSGEQKAEGAPGAPTAASGGGAAEEEHEDGDVHPEAGLPVPRLLAAVQTGPAVPRAGVRRAARGPRAVRAHTDALPYRGWLDGVHE